MKAILAAALAACLSVAAPSMLRAQTAPNFQLPQTYDLKVCNRSGRNATVAAAYKDIAAGRFTIRGWFPVNDGACIDLVSTNNSVFYMYADATDGSGRSWSGSHPLCAQYPGPYTFWPDASRDCPSGYETRNFVPMSADEPGPYTWTLDP
jgi:uncharacterized membrane protein